MATAVSDSLRLLLAAIQANPSLQQRLEWSMAHGPANAAAGPLLLIDVLEELVAAGQLTPPAEGVGSWAAALQGELDALMSQTQLLSDEQLEAVAAGRMDVATLLCVVAGSVSLGNSTAAPLLMASSPLAALGAPVQERVLTATPVQEQPKPHPAWMAPALAIIKDFEGLELEAYVDAVGVVTIGWGTTVYENGRPVKMGERISAKRAEELLVNSILREYAPGVFQALPMARSMEPAQQAALISFTYNVGVKALQDSTLRRRLLAGEDPQHVIRQELPRWCFGDGGEVLAGLERRRAAEVALFVGKG